MNLRIAGGRDDFLAYITDALAMGRVSTCKYSMLEQIHGIDKVNRYINLNNHTSEDSDKLHIDMLSYGYNHEVCTRYMTFINLHLCFQDFQFRIFFACGGGRGRACVVGSSGRWFLVWYGTLYIYMCVCIATLSCNR